MENTRGGELLIGPTKSAAEELKWLMMETLRSSGRHDHSHLCRLQLLFLKISFSSQSILQTSQEGKHKLSSLSTHNQWSTTSLRSMKFRHPGEILFQ